MYQQFLCLLQFLKELHQENKISDIERDKLLGDWLWESDLILHEVESIMDGIHTYISELEDLPKHIKDKMLLVHLSDHFHSKEIKIGEEYKTYQVWL